MVADAGNGLEAIEAVRRSQPDVVVLDINMRHMKGIEATTRIKIECPYPAVMGLSVQHEQTWRSKGKMPTPVPI